MIARFEWQHHRRQRRPHIVSLRGRASLTGWLLVAGLTILFVLWLGYRSLAQPVWLSLLPPVVAELLGLAEAAGAFTLGFLWLALWWRRKYRRTFSVSAPDVAQLYALSPAEFEEYVAQLFRRQGYRVELRGRSGDRGVDLELVKPGGKRAIVQCKRYQHTVGAKVVRELYGTLIHEKVAHAFLVTTAEISGAAREWARNKPMTLVDGETLAQVAAVLGDGVTGWQGDGVAR